MCCPLLRVHPPAEQPDSSNIVNSNTQRTLTLGEGRAAVPGCSRCPHASSSISSQPAWEQRLGLSEMSAPGATT
jgi:hypothetical protein